LIKAVIVSASDPSAELSPAFILPMAIPFAILGASILGWFLFVVYGRSQRRPPSRERFPLHRDWRTAGNVPRPPVIGPEPIT
jgi:hypothetical protein